MRARLESKRLERSSKAPVERRGLPTPNTGEYWSSLDLDEFQPSFEAPTPIGPGMVQLRPQAAFPASIMFSFLQVQHMI
jgi:hypothetical protein